MVLVKYVYGPPTNSSYLCFAVVSGSFWNQHTMEDLARTTHRHCMNKQDRCLLVHAPIKAVSGRHKRVIEIAPKLALGKVYTLELVVPATDSARRPVGLLSGYVLDEKELDALLGGDLFALSHQLFTQAAGATVKEFGTEKRFSYNHGNYMVHLVSLACEPDSVESRIACAPAIIPIHMPHRANSVPILR